MTLDQMGLNEWLIIGGTLLGPILAVQAQKWIERYREGKNRREWVFLQLMATRQHRISPDHVRALNSIDIAFYGSRAFGRLTRTAPYQDVLDSWNVYRRHLSPADSARPATPEELARWNAKADELFVNLLERLAVATGYDFKREELQSGSYAPQAHGQIEEEEDELRRKQLDLLRGNLALPLEIKAMPRDEQALSAMLDMQNRMVLALESMAANAKNTSINDG